jgi:hypothetical protein
VVQDLTFLSKMLNLPISTPLVWMQWARSRLSFHTGKDYFVVLYSQNKLDIDSIKSSSGVNIGSIAQRLGVVLGNGLIGSDKINFSQNSIEFSYNSSRGVKLKNSNSIIAVIIEFDHI